MAGAPTSTCRSTSGRSATARFSISGARRAARHRRHGAAPRIGALTTTRTDPVAARPHGRPADAGRGRPRSRRRADSEPRHDRRQRRERVAGWRHPAGARRGRRRVVLRSAAGVRRVPFTAFYTRLSPDRRAPRRADRRVRDLPAVAAGSGSARSARARPRRSSKSSWPAWSASRPRIALGSVAPTVVRCQEPRRRSPPGHSEAQRRCWRRSRRSTICSTADYRRRVAANLLTAFWERTAGAAHWGNDARRPRPVASCFPTASGRRPITSTDGVIVKRVRPYDDVPAGAALVRRRQISCSAGARRYPLPHQRTWTRPSGKASIRPRARPPPAA